MTKRITYEFKEDKRGRKYANRIDIKTGKKQRVPYKKAQKRYRDQVYREKRKEIEKELEKKGSNWNEYQRELKKSKKRVETKAKEKGVRIKKETVEKRAEKETLEKLVGVRSRYRFAFKYWELPDCNTPVFIADAQAFDGDHFNEMCEFCDDVFNNILESDICPKALVGGEPVQGGACVVVYRKSDKHIIKKYGLLEGC